MAGQMQLTFLLAIIACLVHGVPVTIEQNYFTDDDIEIRANLDKTVDALLPNIRKLILDNGMDPMLLIDISEYIFPDLPGKFRGNVELKKGYMQNLSLLKRTNHVTAIYKDKRLTLDMNFGFNVMDFSYEYDVTFFLFKRQGDIYGRLYELDTNVVVTVDLKEYNLILDSIKFSSVGKYDIKFEGHLFDSLVNILTKIVTVVFRGPVLTVIEEHASTIFDAKVNEWNTMVPRPNRMEIIHEWLDIVNKPHYVAP